MKRLLFSAGTLLLACGCHGAPVISSFTADRTELQAGDVVTLTVVVQDASRLVLDPGGNELRPVSHSFQVVAKETVELVLTASRPVAFVGHFSSQARLTLHVTPRALAAKLTAAPAQVLPGGSTTLTWDATPATSVTLSAGTTSLGDHAGKGTLAVTPSATTTYSLQPHLGDPAPPPAVVAVRVVPIPAVHLSADKTITTAGDAVRLSWTSANATGFSLDNGLGYLGGVTSVVVHPAQTTTYRVTAFGPAGGTGSDAVTVTISGPAPGSRTLSYTDPLPAAGTRIALRKDASSTPALLVLNVVTLQAISAGGLSISLPLDVTRVQLDAGRSGDTSPGFVVNPGAIDPGPAPLAAKAVFGTGPLAGTLVLALAHKARAPGVVDDATLPAGTVLCTLRLVPTPAAQPGPVFAGDAAVRAFLVHLPRDPTSQPEPIGLGTLTLE